MAGLTKIVGVGFLGSLGFTFIILGCVLSGRWWPLLMFLFYAFTPLPFLFMKSDGYDSLDGEVNKSLDLAIFFVTGIVVSTFALPILLTKTPLESPAIDSTTAILTELATVIFYATAGLFFAASDEEFD